MSGRFWVPPTVSREHRRVTAQHDADVLVRAKAALPQFNYDLKQIDEHLELVYVDSETDTGATPLKAGYYHVLRHNPGAPVTVQVVGGPNGEFMEPTSALFEQLRFSDLWNEQNMSRLRSRHERAAQAAERHKIREREDRHEETKDRWNAATRTSVSMTDAAPWTQNTSGAAKRARNDKKAKREPKAA